MCKNRENLMSISKSFICVIEDNLTRLDDEIRESSLSEEENEELFYSKQRHYLYLYRDVKVKTGLTSTVCENFMKRKTLELVS